MIEGSVGVARRQNFSPSGIKDSQMKSRSSKIQNETGPAKTFPESAEPTVEPVSQERIRAILDEIPVQAWCALSGGETDFHNRAWLAYAGVKAEDAGRYGMERHRTPG